MLARAISSEEDDARIYRTYAERLHDRLPVHRPAVFEGMAAEEDGHRRRLIELTASASARPSRF